MAEQEPEIPSSQPLPEPNYEPVNEELPSNIVPGPNGSVLQSGDFYSPNFNPGNAGWKISANGDVEFNNGTFRGNLAASTIDIGGSDTTSFHVDIDGNLWLGAATLATAPAKILNTGQAFFTSIQIGGAALQYQIGDGGIFSFGDGSDGDVVISADTTLTRDMYYENLTVNATKVLSPAGYRIFVRDTLTLNGTIRRNGNNGNNGSSSSGASGAAGGTGGAALADGYLKGAPAGGNGSAGGDFNVSAAGGGNGSNVANSLSASNGALGGNGADTGFGNGTGGQGVTTPSNVKLIANWHLATLLDIGATGTTIKFNPSASSGGGSGGAGSNGNNDGGGGGGGAGSGGGVLAIYAKTIVISATGAIQANGGNGGNGGNGVGDGSNAGGVGGGGGGGNGGILILAYNSLTNAGAITASGGTGGLKGTIGNSSSATDGAAGNAGTIYQFQLSL